MKATERSSPLLNLLVIVFILGGGTVFLDLVVVTFSQHSGLKYSIAAHYLLMCLLIYNVVSQYSEFKKLLSRQKEFSQSAFVFTIVAVVIGDSLLTALFILPVHLSPDRIGIFVVLFTYPILCKLSCTYGNRRGKDKSDKKDDKGG
jgi:hypothetical protein